MIDNFGQRLFSARKMAGLSMEALAWKAGGIVTKQAIGKYEKGRINPGSETLIALANVLDVKVDYFFRTSQVTIAGIVFRKRSRLSKKEEDRIKYQAVDFIERYIEIEKILNASDAFENPVSNNYIKNLEDVERAAMDIRQKWNLGSGPVSHLIELLEDNGFKIFEVAADDRFDGLSGFVANMDIPVIAVLKNAELVRKRFTIAHELGHLLLDFDPNHNMSAEKLCHAFAGALLLPKEVMMDYLVGRKRQKITAWELKKLKGIYGVSMLAIMARAHHLDIISDSAWRQFNIYVNKHGWRKLEPGLYKGRETANRFKQLVLFAAAEQLITYSKAAELLNQPLVEFEQGVQIVS